MTYTGPVGDQAHRSRYACRRHPPNHVLEAYIAAFTQWVINGLFYWLQGGLFAFSISLLLRAGKFLDYKSVVSNPFNKASCHKKEFLMKKNLIFSVMLACLMVSGFVLSGCATNVAPPKNNVWPANRIDIDKADYTVLGPITVERTFRGFVGVTIPATPVSAPYDAFIVQRGGINYSDVIEETLRIHPEADAVIDMKTSFRSSFSLIFYAQRVEIITGIAIKYAPEQKNSRSHLTGAAVIIND